MRSETTETDRIGPELSLDDVAVPRPIGERLRSLYGAESTPETAAGWIEIVRDAVEDVEGRQPTVDDLCTATDGVHTFESDDHQQSYVCVLDPIAYAFLTGTTGTVRSVTPVREAEVTVAIRGDGVDVSHDDAVVSLGVSGYVDDVDEPSLETTYRQVCGYIQTFADEAEYETWAADVEAATTPLSAETGVAVGRELATALFGRDETEPFA